MSVLRYQMRNMGSLQRGMKDFLLCGIAYVLEVLNLPASYKEKVLRKQIASHLKDLILEFGMNFSFIGEEYRLQVGNTDSFGNDLKGKGQAQELSPAPNLKRGYRQLLAAEVIKSREKPFYIPILIPMRYISPSDIWIDDIA